VFYVLYPFVTYLLTLPSINLHGETFFWRCCFGRKSQTDRPYCLVPAGFSAVVALDLSNSGGMTSSDPTRHFLTAVTYSPDFDAKEFQNSPMNASQHCCTRNAESLVCLGGLRGMCVALLPLMPLVRKAVKSSS
jgi:hypothetical protein